LAKKCPPALTGELKPVKFCSGGRLTKTNGIVHENSDETLDCRRTDGLIPGCGQG